jgi:hypothetical protein
MIPFPLVEYSIELSNEFIGDWRKIIIFEKKEIIDLL